MSDIPLDEVIYFDVITNSPTTGAAADATAIVYDVYEETTDTPILPDQTMTKRFTGHYKGDITANAANGFEVGKWYNVVVEATVGGVAAKAVVKNFRVTAAEGVVGVPDVNTTHVGDTLQTALNINDILTDTAQIGVAGAGLTNIGTIATVTNLTNLPTIPANWLTAAGTAADFTTEIQSGLATPTNITAGTITTVTNLTNAPTNGDLTATMKTSVTTAASSSTPSVTVSDKTGFSLSTAGILAIWHQLTSAIVTAGTAGKLLVDNLNATVSSRATSAKQDTMETTLNAAATASALATVDTVVDAVKVQTDKMVFTKTNELDVNTKSINDAEVIGDGNATPWDGV